MPASIGSAPRNRAPKALHAKGEQDHDKPTEEGEGKCPLSPNLREPASHAVGEQTANQLPFPASMAEHQETLFTAPRVSNTIFGPPRCSSQVQLMILRRYGFARQVLIVEDCVEYQSVRADGLATIDGVVAEQQHVPAT